MIIFLVTLSILFLLKSNNLLLSLLILEIISFMTIFYFSFVCSSFMFSDFLMVVLFSVFVMEGVIGLSGLISLVSYSGSDYISSNSLMKC